MDTRLDDRYGFTDDPTIGLLEATALARAPGADTHSLLWAFAASVLAYVDTPTSGDGRAPDTKTWDIFASVSRQLGMMDTYDPTGNSLALSQLYVLWRTLGHLRNHSKYREVRNLADGLIAAMPMLIASVARREGASDEANLALSEVVFSGSTDMLPTEDWR